MADAPAVTVVPALVPPPMARRPSTSGGFIATARAAVDTSGDVNPHIRSPGPVHNPNYSLVQPTPRQSSMKGREWFGSIDAVAATQGRGVPGPGAYPAPPPLISRAASLAGRTYFGSIEYEVAKMGKDVPGPGSYAAADTPATRRGGGGGQAPALKGRVDVFIKPAHTVGPGSYFESLQQDRLLSLRPSTRKIDFGAGSPRGSEPAGLAASAGRGPGMYPEGLNADRKLSTSQGTRSFTMRGKRSVSERMSVDAEFGKPAESVGPQALSTKRTAPAPSLKSRTRFGSPYNF